MTAVAYLFFGYYFLNKYAEFWEISLLVNLMISDENIGSRKISVHCRLFFTVINSRCNRRRQKNTIYIYGLGND